MRHSSVENARRGLLLFILHSSFFILHSISTAYAGEIDIARQALRDGLWEVARTHARKAEGDMAKVVVLESFARENKWSDVLSTVEAYGKTEVPDLLYYKAAALYMTGSHDAARKVLESVDFSRGVFAADASALHAAVLRQEGYVDAALAKLDVSGGDFRSKLQAAAIRKAKGEDAEASKLWREVIAMTNVPEEAVSIAAANLSDVPALRHLVANSVSPQTVRFAGIRLGVLLVRDKATFDEGARLIRKIVKDSPDFRGARQAFLALADAELARGDFAAAGKDYGEAIEIWPETAKEASVHQGLGWAYAETSNPEAALAEFNSVLSLASDDETKSLALVKSGDALMALGRGDEAMSRYREALAKCPESIAAKKVKAMVELHDLERKGREEFAAYRFEEARKIFAEVARRDPSQADRMRYCDMVCLFGLGRDQAAERLAAQLSATSSDASVKYDSSLWLAKFLYNNGRYREAESNFLACACSVKAPASPADPFLWATRAAFAAGEFQRAVQNATKLDASCPATRAAVEGLIIQAEALIELARFDEAVLVADKVTASAGSDSALRLKAQLLRADALFAMGADNPVRYREALEAYTQLRTGEKLEPSVKIRLSYKLAKTLERLKRMDEAIDEYYTRVIMAFREGKASGVRYDDEAIASFSRAAFRLAEELESRGSDPQAVRILNLVETAGVPASSEARKRIARIHRKGQLL